ncbi:MAG TPA: RNA polymerase subunit sigma-70, partial [Acidimicrobiales bacterium]|nr:RNA polymerase subunit sigma-70 [Acidimicrobiales bacterium]
MITNRDHSDDALVDAAARGDRAAFEALVVRHRKELHAHCYRLLASPEDADDAVQEATVRAWRGLQGFERRSSFRTWLFKITTNAALDLQRRRSRRELPIELGPASKGPLADAVDLLWVGPFDGDASSSPEAAFEARETVELAYVLALQHLPVRQRAVFVLREVLGFSAAETAAILEVTVAAVTSALQRARAALEARLPRTSQQAELASIGDQAVRELAERYAAAIERADLAALLALLTEDVSWSMPPLPSWYSGTADVSEFLTRFVFPERWAHVTTTANAQLAVAGYLLDEDRDAYVPAALDVLELRGGRVASVTGFLTGEGLGPQHQGLFSRFGLPPTLERSRR